MRLGYCGDDCDECPRYRATVSGDLEQLEKLARLWQQSGMRTTVAAPEEMMCNGCSPDHQCTFGIAACAVAHKVANCGECADYPCEKNLKTFAATEKFAAHCRELFSADQYARLEKAFFRKKANLDAVHKK